MAGDVYLVVHFEDHPRFKRIGADLFYKKKISLLEALTGFSFVIEHLDNQKFTVTTSPGEIISHSKNLIFLNNLNKNKMRKKLLRIKECHFIRIL